MHQKNINIYELNGGWQQQFQSQTQKAIEIEENRIVQWDSDPYNAIIIKRVSLKHEWKQKKQIRTKKTADIGSQWWWRCRKKKKNNNNTIIQTQAQMRQWKHLLLFIIALFSSIVISVRYFLLDYGNFSAPIPPSPSFFRFAVHTFTRHFCELFRSLTYFIW